MWTGTTCLRWFALLGTHRPTNPSYPAADPSRTKATTTRLPAVDPNRTQATTTRLPAVDPDRTKATTTRLPAVDPYRTKATTTRRPPWPSPKGAPLTLSIVGPSACPPPPDDPPGAPAQQHRPHPAADPSMTPPAKLPARPLAAPTWLPPESPGRMTTLSAADQRDPPPPWPSPRGAPLFSIIGPCTCDATFHL